VTNSTPSARASSSVASNISSPSRRTSSNPHAETVTPHQQVELDPVLLTFTAPPAVVLLFATQYPDTFWNPKS